MSSIRDQKEQGVNKMNLKEICEQLKHCNFECEGGYIQNNVAFIELEKLAEQGTHVGISTKDLANELENRFDPNKPEYDPGGVNVHSFHCGEEGVIVKYEPYGPEGKDKKPRTLQYGIYNARIIVVNDEE